MWFESAWPPACSRSAKGEDSCCRGDEALQASAAQGPPPLGQAFFEGHLSAVGIFTVAETRETFPFSKTGLNQRSLIWSSSRILPPGRDRVDRLVMRLEHEVPEQVAVLVRLDFEPEQLEGFGIRPIDLGVELDREVVVPGLVVIPDDVAAIDAEEVVGVEDRVGAKPTGNPDEEVATRWFVPIAVRAWSRAFTLRFRSHGVFPDERRLRVTMAQTKARTAARPVQVLLRKSRIGTKATRPKSRTRCGR